MNFNPENAARTDNKRLTGSQEDTSTPIVAVTKSYARLSIAACTLLGVTPGVDSVEFYQDTQTGTFAFAKAVQSTEEGAAKVGKKVSPEGTINSESIYKRLQEGAVYKMTALEAGERTFGVLEIDTEAPSVDELEGNVAADQDDAKEAAPESFAVAGERSL